MTPDIITSPPYNEMRKQYAQLYSLGNLNTDLSSKFALISLICYLTYKAKEKKPDVTHYQIIKSATKDIYLPEDFIKALAVVCEDFSYGCKEFPLFNLKTPKDMIKTIRDIVSTYLPF
jgi:hypothetical protein